MVLVVEVGDGARMFVPHPDMMDGGLEWQLRHGDAEKMRLQAASVVSTMSYLLCDQISMKEATQRLRLMRQAYQNADKEHP